MALVNNLKLNEYDLCCLDATKYGQQSMSIVILKCILSILALTKFPKRKTNDYAPLLRNQATNYSLIKILRVTFN